MPIYYLSFQRAPPLSVSSDDLISISPTIVNDLRDEVYQPDVDTTPLDIRFAWVVRHEGSWKKLSAATECAWQGPSSAYKTHQIRVPNEVSLQGVKTIHLATWIVPNTSADARSLKKRRMERPHDQEWTFDLAALPSPEQDRLVIIPVLSAPIEISKVSTTSKSSNTIRLFRVANSPIVEICEESGYELDKHIWDASLYLTSYLYKALKDGKARDSLPILSIGSVQKGLRVIELGSGTGMVTILLSLLLAQALANYTNDDIANPTHLTATDLPSAIPLLEQNIEVNRGITGTTSGLTITCQSLDWLEEGQIKGTQLVLVSDCTYNPTYFEPLCKTVKLLLSNGKQPAIGLLAKQHRHGDEEELWVEVKKHGLRAKLLAGRQDVQEGHWGLWELTCT